VTQSVLEDEDGRGDRRYDVFLSYNSVDLDAVEQLARRLEAANLRVWFDRWRISAGDDWQDQLGDGLARSDGCLVFIGRAGIGDWARQELKVALDRAAKRRDYRVVPVLLPGAAVPFDPTAELPPFLRLRSWLDLRAGLGGAEVVQQLIEAVHGIAPGVPMAVIDESVCPYQGLRPFEEADSELFFGRDGDVAQLLEKLRTSCFVAVLGPSGSGKSSLVRAGLVPALRAGRIAGADRWRVVTMRPGPRPLAELAAQLTALGHPRPTSSLLDELAGDDRSMALASAAVLAGEADADGLLWVVDQLEELFTLVTDGSEGRFIGNLVDAAADPGAGLRVVVTMRADFYAKCAAFPQLAQLMAGHQHLVSPLEREGWREAIEEPAWRSGLELQSGLVETILDDAVGRPGSLPLLQEALVAVWERRRGNLLTLDGYVAAGRVAGAVAKRADSVYAALDRDQQAVAKELLLRLVHLGEGTEDTRRRAREDELLVGSKDPAAIRAVIERFVNARLVTTSTAATRVATVDVAHEALITGWPRLQTWLDEDREDLRIRQRLSEQSEEWLERGRDESLLYRGAQLRLADDLDAHGRLELSGAEREFLAASREDAQRVATVALEAERAELRRAERDRLRRRVTVGLLCGLGIALVLAGIAFLQSREAARQRERARALTLASQSEVVAPSQLDLGLLLALQARKVSPGVEATGAVLDAVARGPRPARYLRPPPGSTIVAPIAVTPRGDRLLAASSDGKVYVWDPRDGASIASWSAGGHGAVTALATSGSGALVALGHQDGAVVVYDVATGAEVVVAPAHAAAVESVSFVGDSGVVSAARDRPVLTSFVGGAVHSGALRVDDDAAGTIAVSPDGQRMATASTTGVRLWDLATGAPIATLLDASSSFPPSPSTAVAWSADGSRVVVDPGRLQTFDGHTGAPLTDLLPVDTTQDVLAAAAATVSSRGRDVLVWSDGADRPVSLTGHTGVVRSVATSRDGSVIGSAAGETVIVWQPGAGSPLARALRPAGTTPRTATAVTFVADGHEVASASADGVRRWDVGDGGERQAFQDPGSTVTRLAADPARGSLVGGTASGGLLVWDASTGAISKRRDGALPGRVQGVVVSTDGRTIVAADDGGSIVVVDGDSLEPRAAAEHGADVAALAISPDGALLASGGDDDLVRLWRTADLRPAGRLEGHIGKVGALAFSPDGGLLASGADDATVRLWDPRGQRPVATLTGHTDFVLGLGFSPDGHRLVSTGEDASMILWDVEHRVAIGHPLHTASAGFVEDLKVSPDGLTVATVQGPDVVLWDVDEASWLRQACDLADRPFTSQEIAQYLGGRRPVAACPPTGT